MAARNCAKLDVFVKKLTPVKTEPHISCSYLKILDFVKNFTTCPVPAPDHDSGFAGIK